MRARLAAYSLCLLSLTGALACKSQGEPPPTPARVEPTPTLPAPDRPSPRAASSEVVALEKALQVAKLRPPPRRGHQPRLAFAKGVFARLGVSSLQVFDSVDFRLLLDHPLEGPRALLALADGSLLALGGQSLLRWQLGQKSPNALPRFLLLPGAELYADAQRADVIWVLDATRGGSLATLSSFRLTASDLPLLLPEQTIALTSPRGGVFGATREGVWLYLTPGHAERFGPTGARLSGLDLAQTTLPTWVLAAPRLDQSFWLDEAGHVARVLVSPRFKPLAQVALAGHAFAADVGDEGRLLAVVVVTGEGPRFELQLLDEKLGLTARVVLPAEPPTGSDDWVQVVTRNESVAVAGREPRVAVGGPDRVLIFDAAGKVVFSIPSR